MTTERYRVVRDEHGARILRDNAPISLEQAVAELHALQHEVDAVTTALGTVVVGLKRLVEQAEQGELT